MTYGLGTENQNLPGYVVLCPETPTTVGPPLWGNGFLPGITQGTFIANKVETLGPDGMPMEPEPEPEKPKEMDKDGKDKAKDDKDAKDKAKDDAKDKADKDAKDKAKE